MPFQNVWLLLAMCKGRIPLVKKGELSVDGLCDEVENACRAADEYSKELDQIVWALYKTDLQYVADKEFGICLTDDELELCGNALDVGLRETWNRIVHNVIKGVVVEGRNSTFNQEQLE